MKTDRMVTCVRYVLIWSWGIAYGAWCSADDVRCVVRGHMHGVASGGVVDTAGPSLPPSSFTRQRVRSNAVTIVIMVTRLVGGINAISNDYTYDTPMLTPTRRTTVDLMLCHIIS